MKSKIYIIIIYKNRKFKPFWFMKKQNYQNLYIIVTRIFLTVFSNRNIIKILIHKKKTLRFYSNLRYCVCLEFLDIQATAEYSSNEYMTWQEHIAFLLHLFLICKIKINVT